MKRSIFAPMEDLYYSYATPHRICSHTKGCTIVVPVTGCSDKDVEITFDKSKISISYEASKEYFPEESRGALTTKGTHEFSITDTLDPENAKAKVENGLLTVEIPNRKGGYTGLIPVS